MKLSRMVTCLDGTEEVNNLIRICFSWRFQWIGATQMSWFQVVPWIQVSSGMLGEGVWMFKWCWDCLNVQTWYSIFEERKMSLQQQFFGLLSVIPLWPVIPLPSHLLYSWHPFSETMVVPTGADVVLDFIHFGKLTLFDFGSVWSHVTLLHSNWLENLSHNDTIFVWDQKEMKQNGLGT